MADIIIEGDGKFPMDVKVPIVFVRAANGSINVTAQGEYRGRQVGAQISIRGQMKSGIIDDDVDKTAFYRSGIVVHALSDTTRHLADVFSEIYILPISDAQPLHSLDLTSFALDGDPKLIETHHLNFKVFHDDEDKLGLYFEMFFHIDIPARYVRFDEKDEGYRKNVIRSFSALRSRPS